MATRSAPTIYDALGFNTQGDTQSVAIQQIARTAAASLLNNPRDNPIMAEPPAITSSASVTSALSNITTWNAASAGVFNFYGGVPTSDGAGGMKALSATVSSTFAQYICRVHTVADCLKIQFKFNDISNTGTVNFIIDGQYVSATPVTPGFSGITYTILDFTDAGGRAVRNIVMEMNNCDFISASVLPTETLNKPGGVVRSVFAVGDSITASGGMTTVFNGYFQVLCDILGVQNAINGGVGGTGFLAAGGQLTFRGRVADMVACNPDVILIAGGHNDTGSTAAAITTEVLAYLTAIRAQRVLANTPIIFLGVINGLLTLALTQPVETAIAAAITAFNDPSVIFVPLVNDPSGPIFTGTGYSGHTASDGNFDIYGHSDAVHPNDAGHNFLARRIADRLMTQVLV
jgi:lysophospholipase L1-like esterase